MKNLLIIGLSSNLGGVETFIINYYRELRKNINIDFLIYEENCVFQKEIEGYGGKIYKIIPSRYREWRKFHSELRHFFSENGSNYDAVWMNDCSLAKAGDLKIAARYGINTRIFHSHNNRHMRKDKKSIFYYFIHEFNKVRIKNLATDYWACSDLAGKFAFGKLWSSSERSKVIFNAINLENYYYQENVRMKVRTALGVDGKFVVGNVGRLHFQKNQEFLLHIFCEIHKKIDDAVLLLVGDGEERENLKIKIKELNIQDSVLMLGLRDDVSDLMQAMDVFVLPSRFEGLGIVLIEAQASGLPTFASKNVIPNAAMVEDYFWFIELNRSPSEWAKVICEHRKANLNRECRKIGGSHYNIKNEAKIVAKYFAED